MDGSWPRQAELRNMLLAGSGRPWHQSPSLESLLTKAITTCSRAYSQRLCKSLSTGSSGPLYTLQLPAASTGLANVCTSQFTIRESAHAQAAAHACASMTLPQRPVARHAASRSSSRRGSCSSTQTPAAGSAFCMGHPRP